MPNKESTDFTVFFTGWQKYDAGCHASACRSVYGQDARPTKKNGFPPSDRVGDKLRGNDKEKAKKTKTQKATQDKERWIFPDFRIGTPGFQRGV